MQGALQSWLQPHLSGGSRIAAYRSLPEEVSLERFLPGDRAFAFPRVTDAAQGLMEFRLARLDEPSHWRSGKYGITEPSDACSAVPPDQIDVIFVPGVAFSVNGERLGRGKGFYDRMLARMPRAIKVAVLFSEQWSDSLPVREWDQRVDVLISPERVIGF